MRARCVIGEKLDRAETVGKMDGQCSNEEHDNHRYGGERHEGPDEDEQSANYLDNDRSPAQKKREWHADRVQDANEVVGTASEFGIAVFEKSVAHNQSKRDCEPILRNRERRKSEPPKERIERHTACFGANAAMLLFAVSVPLSRFRGEDWPRGSPPQPRRQRRAGVACHTPAFAPSGTKPARASAWRIKRSTNSE